MVGGPPQFHSSMCKRGGGELAWRGAVAATENARTGSSKRESEKKLASARFKYHQLVFGHYSWFVNEKQCGTAVKEKKNFLHL